MNKTMRALLIAALLGLTPMAAGCHADANDPAGQAKELEDPIRRQNALTNITRLFQDALARSNGNREEPGVKAIIDATVEPLTKSYLENEADVMARKAIIDLLKEMRDARSLPALLKALEWRIENEEPAIAAAQTFQTMTLSDDQKGQASRAIGAAIERVTGARQVDNRMRVEFLRALGNLAHPAAVAPLAKIATQRLESQQFLINRLAYEQLVKVANAESIPAFVQALMFCDARNPAMRVNDLASLGFVTIGRASVPVLQQVIAGQNELANAAAEEYMAAARAKDPMIASRINAPAELAAQALAVLGDLGDASAIPALIAETQSEDESRRRTAAIALIRVHRGPADSAAVTTAIKSVYERADKPTRAQLSAGLARLMDPSIMPFLLDNAKRPEDELPDIRVLSFGGFALFANAAEAAQARELIGREPGPEEGGFKTNFMEYDVALQTATECNEDVACYVRKLDDANKMVVRKAAFMIARYGRGNAEALTALIAKIDHREREVREDVLYAVDFLIDGANQAALDKIAAVQRAEEGRSSWEQMKVLALTTAGRLRLRAGN